MTLSFLKNPSKVIFFIALFASLVILAAPIFFDVGPRIARAAAVVLLAVSLWSTAVIPPAMGSIIFLFTSVIMSVAPPSIVFSGFHAGATWLVFGGLVVGLGVKRSALDMRLVNILLKRIPSDFLGMSYSIFFVAFVLAWIVPSASARVALLVPIILSLSDGLGFRSGSKGSNGLVLAGTMGTMTPAFGILPSNVPNMALFGAIENIHNIRLTYAEYLVLNFPVIGIGALVIYPLVITVLFSEKPEITKNNKVFARWSKLEKRLFIVLLVALVFWFTDTLHGVSPAWVALGAALVCLLPKVGVLDPRSLGTDIDYGPVLFVAGVIGLGGIATYTGLGHMIASAFLEIIPLENGADGRNFCMIVFIGAMLGLFTTMPAQPSIMVPMASEMLQASGWSLKSILFAPVITWSMFPFFYQAPPVVLAVALGGLNIWWVIRLLIVYMIISVVTILPLHFFWGQYLGYFLSEWK